MLTLHFSNQLSVLKAMLVRLLEVAPLEDPFAREQILVQSPGMAQWLKLELAQAFGIVANVEFPLPASFIWEMFTRVLPEVPRQSPYNKAAMSWQLMAMLPGLLNRPSFAPLAGYLSPNGELPEQVRLWQLCQQIADLFDQYLVYRPDWIASWEQGEGLPLSLSQVQGQAWQPELWRELVARTLQLAPSGYHRANLYDDFIEVLQSRQDLAVLPGRILVFGISALPPRYVDALRALGERVEVHLFVTNPCQHYWGDILDHKTLAKMAARFKPGRDLTDYQGPVNPLLASMGKQGRDYLQQLLELEANEVSFYDDRYQVDDPAQCGLLQAVQQDVLTLSDRGGEPCSLESSGHKSLITHDDFSLQIHACHGPMRELEVLHDRLLDLFARDSTLTPKDVVVMMPDVNSYGPAIQAVFGARGQIPYSISDRSVSQENPLLLSLLALLRLPDSRLGAAELLAILEVPAVLARFELDGEAFDQLRIWVQEVGIRWGLDNQYPQRFNLPPLQGNSWLFGLRRMLLGYAMGDGAPVQGILPYAELEGQQAVWLGKLAAFIDTLEAFLPELQQSAPLPVWSERIQRLLAAFYLPDAAGERVLQLVSSLLLEWQQKLGEAHYGEPITPALMAELMKMGLSNQRSSQRFLAGQLNFCALMPMRSIPFRQVCLLGMNDGVYPRTLPPMGFDLLAQDRRRGDRSRREDDRYLFLEAILSAQQGLYISYQGFSVQDGTRREPSVLLAELLEYCRQGFVLAGDEALSDEKSAERLLAHLVLKHPLTPYSHSYFFPEPGSRLFTYAREWLPALTPKAGGGNFQSAPLPLPEAWGEQLELAELLRFYRQPARYFLNRRLKVWFEPLEASVEEREPFALDALQHYQLKSTLLNAFLQEEEIGERRQRLQLAGQLPQGWFGELLMDEVEEPMAELAAVLAPWLAPEPQTLEVAIVLPQGCLQGWLVVREGRLILHKPGHLHGRDFLLAWIQHLCLSLSAESGMSQETLLFDMEMSWRLRPVPASDARAWLGELVASWAEGMTRPLPIFPKSAWAWINSYDKEPDLDKAQKAAQNAFNDGWNTPGEGSDPYVTRCFPELDEVTLAAMSALAQQHMQPLLAYLEERQ